MVSGTPKSEAFFDIKHTNPDKVSEDLKNWNLPKDAYDYLMTIAFSGNTDFKVNKFIVEKGYGELDEFVVTGKNVNNNVELMILKANIIVQVRQ